MFKYIGLERERTNRIAKKLCEEMSEVDVRRAERSESVWLERGCMPRGRSVGWDRDVMGKNRARRRSKDAAATAELLLLH